MAASIMPHLRVMLNSKRCTAINCMPGLLPNTKRLCSSSVNDFKESGKATKLSHGPSLKHFIDKHRRLAGSRGQDDYESKIESNSNLSQQVTTSKHMNAELEQSSVHPYIAKNAYGGHGRKVYFETYGCQMNVNDTEIVWSVLNAHGFAKTKNLKEADVVLLMTCSIREGAEKKIWNRVDALQALKRRKNPVKIGILGCMAERLKSQILEEKKSVDLVCGPDAYKDLPRLLSVTYTGQTAVNVLLSLEETYADVMPIRLSESSPSAFVSIMRGCDNMCSYCIVPFTRGRERSRPITSILDEVKQLRDQGIKEVTLLGQNVNSYRDLSEYSSADNPRPKSPTNLAKGFKTIYKTKLGGLRFADLLDHVSASCPDMRIRFTSPHPKDFPDEVLQLIKERANICKQIHIPAQSGSTAVLEAMRRGYSREAYLELIQHIKETIPGIKLSSDFIAGFCGETEEDHLQTLSMLDLVRYHCVFYFPYSLREKTHAHRRLKDDVPHDVKLRRHEEISVKCRGIFGELNAEAVGETQLVLIESDSKRSADQWAGRNDGNTKVIFNKASLPVGGDSSCSGNPSVGDYVAVHITESSSQTLKGEPLFMTSLQTFSEDMIHHNRDSHNTQVLNR